MIVEKTVQDLMNLMHDLSAYSDQFLNMVCVKLQEYKDTCSLAYRYSLGQHSGGETAAFWGGYSAVNGQELLLEFSLVGWSRVFPSRDKKCWHDGKWNMESWGFTVDLSTSHRGLGS